METFISYIPVTVISAVALFVTKESVEGIRRYRGEVRKKEALRILLARECELNHWTIKTLKRIVTDIRDEYVDEEENEDGRARSKFRIIYERNGKVIFREEHVTGGWSQAPIPITYRETMNKNLLEIAMLDKKLFIALQPAYDAVAEIQHVRDSLVQHIESHANEKKEPPGFLHGFSEYALEELNDAYENINKLHIECTGNSLKEFRMR